MDDFMQLLQKQMAADTMTFPLTVYLKALNLYGKNGGATAPPFCSYKSVQLCVVGVADGFQLVLNLRLL